MSLTAPDRAADSAEEAGRAAVAGPEPQRPGTRVVFDVCARLPITPEEAWRELVDWRGHGDWIPLTRVEVDPADPSRFVAWSGIGRLALEDRMRADEQRFDGSTGRCHVSKLGPVLVGAAELSVTPGLVEGTSVVQWHEDVTVPRLPRVLAPAVAWVSARLFGAALRRMAKQA